MTHPWVGIALAALLAPFTAGIVVVAIQRWKRDAPGRTYSLLGACCYVLITVGVAVSGFAPSVGAAVAGVGILGFLARGVVGLNVMRRRHRATGG